MAAPIDVVIDLLHHQETVDFEQMKGAGVVGAIYKATQELTYADAKHVERCDEAHAKDLLWSAYYDVTGPTLTLNQVRELVEHTGRNANGVR